MKIDRFFSGLVMGSLAASAVAVLAHRAAPPAVATPLPGQPVIGHSAEVVRIVDSDTFDAKVRLWPGLEITTRVRLRGIDAPELASAQCSEERRQGEAARDALSRLLAAGAVTVSDVGLDKYGGRVLATVSARGQPDVGAAMIATRHARSYDGGRRAGWCGTQAG